MRKSLRLKKVNFLLYPFNYDELAFLIKKNALIGLIFIYPTDEWRLNKT
jgi:hypothetical protein